MKPIDIRNARRCAKADFAGVISEGVCASDGILKLSGFMFRAMKVNAAEATADSEQEALHDLRVAMRRFRAVLRLARKELGGTSAKKVDKAMSKLAAELSPIRDGEVWVAFLKKAARKGHVKEDDAWLEYLASQGVDHGKQVAQLKKILKSDRYKSTMKNAEKLLDKEMPELNELFISLAASGISRRYRKMTAKRIAITKMSAEAIHKVRKQSRRLRYWAEFAAPVMGSSMRTLSKRFKAVADALGDVHDMDVHLERLESQALECPADLLRHLKRKRRKYIKDFLKAWEPLTDTASKKKILSRLDRIVRL